MRGRPLTQADLARWLTLLGFTTEYIRQKLRARSYEEAVQRWAELKEDIRKQWRKMAFELHPDRNGGDDKKFKEVKEAYDMLQKVEPTRQPPPARRPMGPRMVVIRMSGGGFNTSTNATTGSTFYSSSFIF